MTAQTRPRLLSILLSLVMAMAITLSLSLTMATSIVHAANAASPHQTLNCGSSSNFCTEVYDSDTVFGEDHYVGHDEPSTLFYSNVPGSGNRMRYDLTLPKDPPPTPMSGRTYNFELHPAFWFGMAMCDTQSFPEQVSTCTPDSDTNIVDPAVSAAHPGTAFMEMQFYPPGWAPWPAGVSCDATKWCAALNIDSLSENPVTGQFLNATCQAITNGPEYVNFAFITKNGTPQPGSPPNPVQSTINTFTPNPASDLFMNSGDKIVVTMHDTAQGLKIEIQDRTSHQSGSMTASAANGFGQVQFDPTGTSCNNIPYDFHPMYSTSSEQTRVTWAAHSYNIAFADEIGHFDLCNGTVNPDTSCTGTEGRGSDQEPTDSDDVGCFPASASLLVQVSGCIGENDGFDGLPYQQNVWPDGNTKLHPTPILFSSPTTGWGYDLNYSRMAFEADLPRIEATVGSCNRTTGAGCSLFPTTDDGTLAPFYPFFSIARDEGSCKWEIGSTIPHSIDFGGNIQYGPLLQLTYTGLGGTPIMRFNDFRQVLSHNPCRNE